MTIERFTNRYRWGIAIGVVIVGLVVTGSALVVGGSIAGAADEPAETRLGDASIQFASNHTSNETVSEEAVELPVPEPGDLYYEATDPDGEWISYINPRDEYRDPYLGDGSGKICVTLVNEAGEPITGETVPNTTVTIPTGETIDWHSQADPFVVEYPLTEHYDRPLDADQFGTTADLPQGDGYLDSHCLEWHGPRENATISYGEAEIEGEYADHIDLVGYIQQAHEAWDTDVDPIEDAVPYEAAGGGWTYETNASHGQAVVVLQLDRPETDGGNESNGDSDGADDGTDDSGADGDDGSDDSVVTGGADVDERTTDGIPGFGVLAAVVALTVSVLARASRR